MRGKGGPENGSCTYKGARQRSWGTWVSEIRVPNNRSKRLWLGSYGTAREAAIAYDNAAWRLYGETARLNFPELIQPDQLSVIGATSTMVANDAASAAGGAGRDGGNARRSLFKKVAGTSKPLRKKPMRGKGGPENGSCTYKGARQRSWGTWVSEIRVPNNRSKRLWLGSYGTAREAAIAYDNAAWRLYREAARLNFPELIQPDQLSVTGATSPMVANDAEEEIWRGLGVLAEAAWSLG